jgi:hypothetical protein
VSLEQKASISSSLPHLETTIQPGKNEEIIQEIQERKRRENNIIIVGIAEQSTTYSKDRIAKDETEVLNVFSLISPDIPKPNKIFRIGKYNAEKTRRIKACLENREQVKLLLRNKDKLPPNIHFFSDQTPAQQKHFQAIKDELAKRKNEGENDLIIKYIKGTPTIVKAISKNYNNQKNPSSKT